MHLEDEALQRILHNEGDPSARTSWLEHVRTCAACATKLDEARREEADVLALLETVDEEAPAVSLGVIESRARSSARTRAPLPARTILAPGWRRRAAAAIVGLGLAWGAYALPGSPLPRLVERIATRTGLSGRSHAPASPRRTGIGLPVGDRLTITFRAGQPRGTIVVVLTDGSTMFARALDGSPTFATDIDQLVIENAGMETSYEIDLPRSAPSVEIRAGDRVLLRKEGDVVSGALPDERGRYVLTLAP